jgi:hypothetical protein
MDGANAMSTGWLAEHEAVITNVAIRFVTIMNNAVTSKELN